MGDPVTVALVTTAVAGAASSGYSMYQADQQADEAKKAAQKQQDILNQQAATAEQERRDSMDAQAELLQGQKNVSNSLMGEETLNKMIDDEKLKNTLG